MAISISLKDANKDGKGIDFAAYLKAFDKTYEDDSSRSGFNGKVTGTYGDSEDPMKADGYATTEDMRGGKRSVLFDGPEGFIYTSNDAYQGLTHNVYGELSSISFGNKTKIKDLPNDTGQTYTHKQDVLISGFPDGYVSTVGNKGEIMHDLIAGNTKSLMKFLQSDSIVFTGSTGKDTFTAFGKDDTLHGGGGKDILNGGSGADTIYGDAGWDTLNGGGGADTIYGGTGRDTLKGGGGADTFVFAAGDGKDTIIDFGKGADVLDFSGYFADLEAVKNASTESAAGVKIVHDGGSVLLKGWDLNDLTDAHFSFDI